jgi:hypothetical protein
MSQHHALMTAMLLAIPTAALAAGDIVMHRDPGCGGCCKWTERVRAQFDRHN